MKSLILGATGLAGSACASELASAGHDLMLAGRDQGKLEHLKKSLPGAGHRICVWDLEEEARTACQIVREFSPDSVIWAARMNYKLQRFADRDTDPGTSAGYTTRAIHSLAYALLPVQRANGFGRWVFLGSLVGEIGGPGQSEYMLEKNALVSMSRSIALEEGGHGITSNVILCGWIESDRETRFNAGALSKMNVTRRGVTPSEIAFCVSFLLNERAASMTGVELPLCGGANLGWFLGRKQWSSDL